MKVLIETTPLQTTRAGVARYVRNLLLGLRAAGPADIQVAEIGWRMENHGYAQPFRAMKTLAREWGWAKWVAPWELRGAGVLHHTHLPLIPFRRPTRHVVTLHDLALLRYPERFRPWQRHTGIRRLTRLARADRIICVSRFTADEAIRLLGLPAGRLEVVHNGVEALAAGADGALPAGVPAEFFLFLGSLEPGKNLSLLAQAWQLAAEAGRRLPPLVVVGDRWAGVPRETTPPAGWVYLGFQTDAVVEALLQRAQALLFPSLYEGFGYPVVEAMRAGCPVVCGRVASLPEIGGDAALYADLDPAAFLAAIRHLEDDPGLAADLVRRGLVQSAVFTLARCAEETLAVYRETMA